MLFLIIKPLLCLEIFLYSKAFTELSQMNKSVAYTVANAVTLLSIGEMLDVDLTKNFNTSYEKYLDMIYKKNRFINRGFF